MKTRLFKLMLIASPFLIISCNQETLEPEEPINGSNIEYRDQSNRGPIQYSTLLDEYGEIVGDGEIEADNPDYLVNCVGPIPWKCCDLKLYPIRPGTPTSPGALFAYYARTCEPNYTLWLRVQRYQPPTPPAIIGSYVTIWEANQAWRLRPCYSISTALLAWPGVWTSGRYTIDAEIRTGTQYWVPPDPIKPWLGGYWEDQYCAKDFLSTTIP